MLKQERFRAKGPSGSRAAFWSRFLMAYAERSFEVEGIGASYIESDAGGYPLLLIHGSGPGASTVGNWRRVLDPLAERFHVHAMDLIGFGRSSRKPAPPYFDLSLWQRQCEALIARMPGERIGIVAHSVSAVLALRLAASNPRVGQVLTTGAMGAKFAVNQATIRCWTFPPDRDELRRTAEHLVYDKAVVDDAYLDARMAILHGDAAYGPYFSAMFAGDRQAFANEAILPDEVLQRVVCPITMLHGRDDEAFPPEITLNLAGKLPQADVALLARCSHSVAMEHPDVLLAAASRLFRPPVNVASGRAGASSAVG